MSLAIKMASEVGITFLMPRLKEGSVPDWITFRPGGRNKSKDRCHRARTNHDICQDLLLMLLDDHYTLTGVSVRRKLVEAQDERSLLTFAIKRWAIKAEIMPEAYQPAAMAMLRSLINQRWQQATLFSSLPDTPVFGVRFRNS